MTSPTDDRGPERAATPPPGPAEPEPPAAPDSAAWGTPSSPVYAQPAAAEPPAPAAGDTQPITTTLRDTQPLTWASPTAPALVPGTAAPTAPAAGGAGAPPAPHDPWAVRPDATPRPPAAPPGPPVPPAYGPAGGASAPPYGTPPYGGQAPVGPPPGPGGATAPYGAPPYGGQAPYGAPPHGGQPSYGAPPYGAPVPGAAGQPSGYAPQVPTDGLAVASLVTSGAGLLLMAGAPGPIGIGLGIGALVRLKRNGRRGRGLAIAGIALGAVGTLVIGLVVWFVVWAAQVTSSTISQTEELLGGGSSLDQLLEDLDSGSGGSSSQDLDELLGQLDEELGSSGGGSLDDLLSELGETGDASLDVLPSYALPQDVALGTCWVAMPEYYDLRDAEAVPCSQDHDAEVVALLTATGAPATDLTVDDPVLTAALEQCDAAVAALDPELLDWGYTDVWLPHPDQVTAGQLAGYCVYEDVFGTTDSLVAPAGTSS